MQWYTICMLILLHVYLGIIHSWIFIRLRILPITRNNELKRLEADERAYLVMLIIGWPVFFAVTMICALVEIFGLLESLWKKN